MKVILAGLSKTGTKSMAVALQQLGYTVYDFPEHFEYHRKDWMRIMEKGGTTDDFRRMYENVDAVVDMPACYFWDEIHKAFPDAKIILTTRKTEEEWWQSWLKQMTFSFQMPYRLFPYLSPTDAEMVQFSFKMFQVIFGWRGELSFLFFPKLGHEMLFKKTYRMHNAHVIQNAPKDKLLVYAVDQGWGPLCQFLDKSIPATPFPRRNVGGNIMEEYMSSNPVFMRIKRESMLSCAIILVVTLYGGYKVATGSNPFSWLRNCHRSAVDYILNVRN